MARVICRRLCVRTGVLLALGALIAGVVSAPASASTAPPPLPYAVAVCPSNESCTSTTPAVVGLGATGASLNVTITNENSLTKSNDDKGPVVLNSFTLAAPSGFTIATATCVMGCTNAANSPTVSSTGSSVSLTKLNLAYDASAEFSITVDTPTSGCTVASQCTWGTTAYYDYPAEEKTPDADDNFVLDTAHSAMGTVLAQWAFAVQPDNAQINTAIRSTPYNTPAGMDPAVAAVDSGGTAVTYNGTGASVTLAASPSVSSLTGNVAAVSGGTATFTGLEVGTPGYYQLVASSPTSNPNDIASSAPSNQFEINTVVSASQCAATGCSGSTTNGNSTFGGSSSATSGLLVLALDPSSTWWTTGNVPAACDNYQYLSGDQDMVDQIEGADGSLTVKDFVTLHEPNLVAVASTWLTQQFCYATDAATAFTTRGGVPATAVTLPNGSPGWAGLLLSDCDDYPGQPCVTKRSFSFVSVSPLVVTFEIDASIPSYDDTGFGHH